jgi:hypothetical protein
VLFAYVFTPVHPKTLMQANLQQALLPDCNVKIDTGLFRNLAATIDGAVNSQRWHGGGHRSRAIVAGLYDLRIARHSTQQITVATRYEPVGS